ncbi:MAG: ABC transporter permease [Eubacteriales bacterium]|nr:ABC transporter permease [Eubacteriales bacterium]
MMQSMKMAMKSIAGNKLRAFLTMLGIIIGVMALVILVSLVNGATGQVTDTISDLGSNLLTVSISDDKGQPLSLKEAEAFSEEAAIGQTAPYQSASVTGKFDSTNATVEVYGTTAAYSDIQQLSLLLGRFLKRSDVENSTFVCVLSESAATDIIGYTDCLGQQISLDGTKFTVVGVLEEDEDSLTAVFGSGSYVAYIPYTTLIRLSGELSSDVTKFYVSADTGSTMDQAEAAITEKLLERLEEDDDAFTVSSQDVLEGAMSSVTSILQILLGGIAGISLVVGGIGIMNIMLVTVTERTREIGIRKAIGASRAVILEQFLLEAVVLCMLGCGIGIFLSWGILRLVTAVVSGIGLSFSLQANVVWISVGFCFLIGVVFGLYPANKAAKMAPIDALHYGG